MNMLLNITISIRQLNNPYRYLRDLWIGIKYKCRDVVHTVFCDNYFDAIGGEKNIFEYNETIG